MHWVTKLFIIACFLLFSGVSNVFAQSTGEDPEAVIEKYSEQMITIFKGPIAKVLSFVILLACVGALLGGRHRIAISCGVAFIVLLFLQVI